MTFGGSIGTLWAPFGIPWVRTLWDHFGVPWVPFGVPWVPFGTTLAVFRPPWASFWRIWEDCCVILRPSECRKGPEGEEERLFDDFLIIFGDIQ